MKGNIGANVNQIVSKNTYLCLSESASKPNFLASISFTLKANQVPKSQELILSLLQRS